MTHPAFGAILLTLLLTLTSANALAQVAVSKETFSPGVMKAPSLSGANAGYYFKDSAQTQSFAAAALQWDNVVQAEVGFELNPDAEDQEILQTYVNVGPQLAVSEALAIGLGLRYLYESNLSEQTAEQSFEPNLTLSLNQQVSVGAALLGANLDSETIYAFSAGEVRRAEAAIGGLPQVENLSEAFLWISPSSMAALQTGSVLNYEPVAQVIEAGPGVQYAATEQIGLAVDYLQIFERGAASSQRASLSLSYQP